MKPLIVLLAFIAVGLGLLAWLTVGLGFGEPWVPNPENVTQSFVTKLQAARYESAQAELSNELQNRFSVPELEKLDQSLKGRFGNYAFELGAQSQEQGDQAMVDAPIKTERQGMQTIPFQMKQDSSTREWKISSLDALQAAAQPGK